jgi:hypothetical protein
MATSLPEDDRSLPFLGTPTVGEIFMTALQEEDAIFRELEWADPSLPLRIGHRSRRSVLECQIHVRKPIWPDPEAGMRDGLGHACDSSNVNGDRRPKAHGREFPHQAHALLCHVAIARHRNGPDLL